MWGASGTVVHTRDTQDWHGTSKLILDREHYVRSEAGITKVILAIRLIMN